MDSKRLNEKNDDDSIDSNYSYQTAMRGFFSDTEHHERNASKDGKENGEHVDDHWNE